MTRSVALGLAVRDGHLLVGRGSDGRTGERFVRPLGGGIEPGERPEVALRREFVEELDVTIDQAWLVGVLDNRFAYEGRVGHELVHVFRITSRDVDAIPLDAERVVLDEGSPVEWVRLDALDVPLYPAGIDAFLRFDGARPIR